MPETRVVSGDGVSAYFDDLARLRIRVFREFPYLYDGDIDYEQRYLATYAQVPDSVFVIAFDSGKVVGVSTGLPLDQETGAVTEPWRTGGFDPATVFYFGESVLLPRYRGLGIGHRFFDAREAFARALGRFSWTSFCAVERDADHPARPEDHRPLHAFWRARGYRPHEQLRCTMAWKESGSPNETDHVLRFWTRPLDGGPPA
jgi:GNAT superfamily N-acetyltransferase